MPQRRNLQQKSDEQQIQLAICALQQDATLTLREAARVFNVPYRTLGDRRAGKPTKHDIRSKNMRLSSTEELVIVEHILYLEKRGFPPQISAVNDMADALLAERRQPPIGRNWASNFVRRQPELSTRAFRKYDY